MIAIWHNLPHNVKLITAYDQPALGAVYKMVAIEDENGVLEDTIKISSNAEKVSTPGRKQVWRITKKTDGKSEGDYITIGKPYRQNRSGPLRNWSDRLVL